MRQPGYELENKYFPPHRTGGRHYQSSLAREESRPQKTRSSSRVLQPSAGKIDIHLLFLPLHASHSLSTTPVSAGSETAEGHEVGLGREREPS